MSEKLYGICAEVVGLTAKAFMQDKQLRAAVSPALFALMIANGTTRWKSRSAAKKLAKILLKIRDLRSELEALDGLSWSCLTGAPNSDVLFGKVRFGKPYDPIGPLDELEAAVDRLAIEAAGAADWRPKGQAAGRAPNRRAYAVALITAAIYQRLTGKAPGYFTGDPTPFDRMLRAVFETLGIKADTQQPARWAISQLGRQGEMAKKVV